MLAVQCKMAKVALALGVRDLAKISGASIDTISRLEAGEEPKPSTVAAILEARGIDSIDQNGHGPGVRLRDRLEPRGQAQDLGAADGQ